MYVLLLFVHCCLILTNLVQECITWQRLGLCVCFFFQAEDGIRDLVRSRGLGDVYKRQVQAPQSKIEIVPIPGVSAGSPAGVTPLAQLAAQLLSLIHI